MFRQILAVAALVGAQSDPLAVVPEGALEGESKQYWLFNPLGGFRRRFPLPSQHAYLPKTIDTPTTARSAADRFLIAWNQGDPIALLRLMGAGAFIEDLTMLSKSVLTNFGTSTNEMDYTKFVDGMFETIRGVSLLLLSFLCSSSFLVASTFASLCPPKRHQVRDRLYHRHVLHDPKGRDHGSRLLQGRVGQRLLLRLSLQDQQRQGLPRR